MGNRQPRPLPHPRLFPSLPWSSTHLWSMTSLFLIYPSLHAHSSSAVIGEVNASPNCPQGSVPGSDLLGAPWTTAMLPNSSWLDWHPPPFSLASFQASLKCHLLQGCLRAHQAEGVTFPSEPWQQLITTAYLLELTSVFPGCLQWQTLGCLKTRARPYSSLDTLCHQRCGATASINICWPLPLLFHINRKYNFN